MGRLIFFANPAKAWSLLSPSRCINSNVKAVISSAIPRSSIVSFSSSTSPSFARSNNAIERIRRQQRIKENDDECLKALPEAKFMIYAGGRPLLYKLDDRNRPPKLTTFSQLQDLLPENNSIANSSVFLRLLDEGDDVPLFAMSVPKQDEQLLEKIESVLNARFYDIRPALFMVPPEWSGLMTGASSLLRWHKNAKHCWTCKSPLTRNASGCVLKCSSDSCSNTFHPPTSPVGISLIEDVDKTRALLIRQAMYPPGMYSCVAGFVDPGESLEECVAREAAEEAGVEVVPDSLRLLGSHHWPVPAGSLMMGCVVATETENPSPCDHEIEAVRWFTPTELKNALEIVDKNPKLRWAKDKDPDILFVPPRGAIANTLIRSWLNERRL